MQITPVIATANRVYSSNRSALCIVTLDLLASVANCVDGHSFKTFSDIGKSNMGVSLQALADLADFFFGQTTGVKS